MKLYKDLSLMKKRWTRGVMIACVPAMLLGALRTVGESRTTYQLVQPSMSGRADRVLEARGDDLNGDGVDDLLMLTPSSVVPMYGQVTEAGDVIYVKAEVMKYDDPKTDYAGIERRLNP